MTVTVSRSQSKMGSLKDGGRPAQRRVSLAPTLIGVLAMTNVASVILVLLE